jgi:hypothetical protein
MTEQLFYSYLGFGVKVDIYYDDVQLELTRVDVVNHGMHDVYLQANKITNPKKEFSRTFIPGEEQSYPFPNGFGFTLEPQYDEFGVIIVSYTCPDITTYMRIE